MAPSNKLASYVSTTKYKASSPSIRGEKTFLVSTSKAINPAMFPPHATFNSRLLNRGVAKDKMVQKAYVVVVVVVVITRRNRWQFKCSHR